MTENDTAYIAFDTGPGNVLIDAAVRHISGGRQHYDKDGVMGLAGQSELDSGFVHSFIDSIDYFARSPPKTTGRELFSDDMAANAVRQLRSRGISDNGIVANVTRITGETIARAYEQFVIPKYGNIDEIYVCGGGAYNPNLMDFLRKRFPGSIVSALDEATLGEAGGEVRNKEEVLAQSAGHQSTASNGPARSGMPSNAKEAILFAVLGFLCVYGRTVPVAADEMNREDGVVGKITPGPNYRDLLRRAMDGAVSTETLGRIIYA